MSFGRIDASDVNPNVPTCALGVFDGTAVVLQAKGSGANATVVNDTDQGTGRDVNLADIIRVGEDDAFTGYTVYDAAGNVIRRGSGFEYVRDVLDRDFFEDNAPIVAIRLNGADVNYDGVDLTQWDRGGTDLVVDQLEGIPDLICPGLSASPSWAFSNQHICRAIDVAMTFVNNITGEEFSERFTLSPLGDTRTVTFPFDVPLDIEPRRGTLLRLNVTSDAANNATPTITRDGRVAERGEIVISDFSPASGTCINEAFTTAITARNTGDCPLTARAVYRNTTTGQQTTTERATVDGNSERTFTVEDAMTEAGLAEGMSIDVALQELEAGEWRTVGVRSAIVEALTALFQVTGTNYPASIQPGREVTGSFVIQNVGDCPADAAITGTRVDQRTVEAVPPGETRQVQQTFTMPGEGVGVELDIENRQTGDIDDSVSQLINLERTIALTTTPPGQIAVIGGFGARLLYTGNAIGTGFQGEQLEQTDVVAGLGAVTFTGSVEPRGRDVDLLNFASLSYLVVQFEQEAAFVKNRSIAGEGRTFEYNATPIPTRMLRPEGVDPDVSVRPNLLSFRDVVGGVAGVVPLPVASQGRTSREQQS